MPTARRSLANLRRNPKTVPPEHKQKIIEIFLDPDQGPFAARKYADGLGLNLRAEYAYGLVKDRGLLPRTRQVNINDDEVELIHRYCSLALADPPSRHRVTAETLLNKLRTRNELPTLQG
jgi:hypothetical protein